MVFMNKTIKMKKLISLLLILISITTYSQSIDEYLGRFRWELKADSLLLIKNSTGSYDTIKLTNPQNNQILRYLNGNWYNTDLSLTDITNIDFKSDTFGIPYQEGRIYYDSAQRSLVYYNSELEIANNIGFENWIEIYNNTGSTITNGTAVYISGIQDTIPTVTLADKDVYDESRLIGIATHDIENNSIGYITWFGIVRGIDLSGCTAGEVLYLGNDGALTTTRPANGSYIVRAGFALDCSSSGSMLVLISSTEYPDETIKANGFPDFQNTYTTMSFDNASREFKIESAGSDFYFYQLGNKYIKTIDSLTISNTEGIHYIYYDTTSLTEVVNPTDGQIDNIIRNKTPITKIYWDATNSKEIYLSNDRHTFHFDPWVRAYLNFVLKAQWLNGTALTDLLPDENGSLDSHAQFGVGSGTAANEDVITISPTITSTATIPYFYLDGTNWRRDSLLTYSFPVGATPLPQYNQITGGSGTLTEITSGNFVLNHIFIVNDNRDYNKIIAIVGQNEYSSLADAQLGAQSEITQLSQGGINFSDFVPIATVIIEGKTSFTNSVQARIRSAVNPITGSTVDYVDWRGITSGGGGGAISTLSLLDLNDTPSAYVDGAILRSTTGGIEFDIPATTIVNGGDSVVLQDEVYDFVDTANVAYLDQENTFTKKGVFQDSLRVDSKSLFKDEVNIQSLQDGAIGLNFGYNDYYLRNMRLYSDTTGFNVGGRPDGIIATNEFYVQKENNTTGDLNYGFIYNNKRVGAIYLDDDATQYGMVFYVDTTNLNSNIIKRFSFFNNVEIYGNLKVNDIDNSTTDTDKFLVSDSDTVKYRTGAEVLSDIGAASTTSYSNLSTRITNDSTNLADNYTNTTSLNTSLGAKADTSAVALLSTQNTFTEAQTADNFIMDGISLALYQGVSWDSSADTYERLGGLKGIATSQSAGDEYLPIQSDMKRCLMADDGTINYYIDDDNPLMKDGETVATSGTTTSTTANKLVDSGADFVTDGVEAGQYVINTTDSTYSIITAVDDLNTLSLERDIMVSGETYEVGTANYGGADGQVMVEIPKFYYKQVLSGTTKYWYISKYDLPGFELYPAFWKDGQEVNYRYIGAFEGGMFDATTGAMCAKSDISNSIYASGDKMTSVAGTWAKTNETRAEYRTMAAERGTGFRQVDYYLYSAVQLLYLVEYADFNSQSMIGVGRTALSGGGWTADSYIGLTGISVSDGSGTNSVSNGGTSGYLTDYMTYRGIENLFGNVWKMLDGITWDGRWTGSAAAQPVYVTNNSDYFADEGSVNMQHLADASYIGTNDGYISNIESVVGFIPSSVGASSTTKLTDYYYQYSESGRDYWRLPHVGGHAVYGGEAGVFSLTVSSAWSYDAAPVGSRLCF